jgi:ATP-dependent DNA ligase
VTTFRFIPPCSPIRAKEVPAGDGWLHEVKFNGFRVQAHKVGTRVVIYRNGHNFTERFPSIVPFNENSKPRGIRSHETPQPKPVSACPGS